MWNTLTLTNVMNSWSVYSFQVFVRCSHRTLHRSTPRHNFIDNNSSQSRGNFIILLFAIKYWLNHMRRCLSQKENQVKYCYNYN